MVSAARGRRKSRAPFPHMLYKDAIRKYGSDSPTCVSEWSCTK